MLRRNPSKIEVKIDDKDEIIQLRQQRILQREKESGARTPLAPSASAIHQKIRTTQLDLAEKARRLGIDES